MRVEQTRVIPRVIPLPLRVRMPHLCSRIQDPMRTRRTLFRVKLFVEIFALAVPRLFIVRG